MSTETAKNTHYAQRVSDSFHNIIKQVQQETGLGGQAFLEHLIGCHRQLHVQANLSKSKDYQLLCQSLDRAKEVVLSALNLADEQTKQSAELLATERNKWHLERQELRVLIESLREGARESQAQVAMREQRISELESNTESLAALKQSFAKAEMQYQEKISVLEKDIEVLNGKLEDVKRLEAECLTTTALLKQKEDEFTLLERQMTSGEHRIELLRRDHEHAESMLREVRDECARLRQKNSECAKRLESSNESLFGVQAELAGLRGAQLSKEGEISVLKSQIEDLRAHCQDLKESLDSERKRLRGHDDQIKS
jgi:chromosome segregation ATPase